MFNQLYKDIRELLIAIYITIVARADPEGVLNKRWILIISEASCCEIC